ncbi:MAG: hypothetical protein C4525_03000 [Desulfarculus sp.]|nr:MAG: hypothetical protein C4525_03000 [Desulfarculus sp.]
MSGDTEMKFPAGMFKGRSVEDCPGWYLRRVAENWKERTEQDKALMRAVNTELEFRERHGEP